MTTKGVGQSVAAGEYLGVVGASGSASGPHLHFEVWSGSTNTTYKDPYAGTCNTLNVSSWWAAQKSYTETQITKVSTNSTDAVFPACPATETSNALDTFALPFQGAGLAPGSAKFYIFLRNEVSGLIADCKILNPDQSVFSSWTYTSTANNKINLRGFTKFLPVTAGTYTFQATYNGITCSKNFYITTPTGLVGVNDPLQLDVSPNPAVHSITLSGENMKPGNYAFTLFNTLGKVIYKSEERIDKPAFRKDISLDCAAGIYFLSVASGNGRTIKKIIKQDF